MTDYKKGHVKIKDVALEDIDFAVDTSLSWDGNFPKLGKGDYIVTINDHLDEPHYVLVSRRYTSPRGADEAAEIALDAFGERHGFGGPKDEGSGHYTVYASDKVI
jgi:hypothetical protein